VHIPLQIVPYARGIRRIFQGRSSLQSAAYACEVLCPAETAEQAPAVFLPGQLDRATGTPTETTLEMEIVSATATTAQHAPTIAYHIRNAILIDGAIYAGALRHQIADKLLFRNAGRAPKYIKSAALASTFLGTKYVGHWLSDDCLAYILAEQHGAPLCLRRTPSPLDHQQKYEGYFGQNREVTDRAIIDQLVVFQDYAQNSLKRRRYRMLRDRVHALFPRRGRDEFVYLRRGTMGVRRVVTNEAEIIDTLAKHEFKVVDVASNSLESILSALADAKIVVSVEGSQLCHSTYASPDNSGIITLQPPDRFETVHRDWAVAVDRGFGFVIGTMDEGGYNFSPDEILRTTDLMLKSMDGRTRATDDGEANLRIPVRRPWPL
jgi:hypothetical protein